MISAAAIPISVRETLEELCRQSLGRNEALSVSEAIGAIRRDHPGLEFSDSNLIDAIRLHTAAAHIAIENDVPEPNSSGALERWDNEGGAIKKKATGPERREARRRVRNDTDGAQRRERETVRRNRVI